MKRELKRECAMEDGVSARFQAYAVLAVAATTAASAGASAGEILHNNISYGYGETLTIQLATVNTTWSVDFWVSSAGNGYNHFSVGGLLASGSPGPGVQIVHPANWTSSSPIQMQDNPTDNLNTTALFASRISDGYQPTGWGILGDGPGGFVVLADMQWDGTYFDYLQVGWIEIYRDQANQALIIGDWYLGAPGEQVTTPPLSLPGSAVPGLPGLAGLACGAAGLRRRRHRKPIGG